MKINTGFSPALIRTWKADDGVNFAIALAELSNWLLHITWLTPRENSDLSEMKPLWVHVEDDCNYVYDFESGRKIIDAFYKYYVSPIAQKRYPKLINTWSFQTKYYSPEEVFNLPLRVKPTKEKVEIAKSHILNNKSFLNRIPKRINSIPAHIAANYSFGKCILFAKALEMQTGKKAVALINKENQSYKPSCHSVILHDEKTAEDSWGIQSLEHISDRYGFVNYEISENFVNELVKQAISGNSNEYEKQLNDAISIIQQHRVIL